MRAASVTSTVVYTYNAAGLRVGHSGPSGQSVDYTWDWATGVPELLSDGETRYLVGHETLGWVAAGNWSYPLPDALGSVRQTVDAAGTFLDVRVPVLSVAEGWTPYGEEIGAAQAGLGFTGEWFDADVSLQYLRARWYDVATGRFTQVDPQIGVPYHPHTIVQDYAYGRENPIMWIDPSGMIEQWWEDMLRNPHWRSTFFDSAQRHNHQQITALDDQSFAAVLASIVLIEGGNLGGASSGLKGKIGKIVGPLPEDIRIPLVSGVKWGEILYNRWLDVIPICYGWSPQTTRMWQGILEENLPYQSEGLVNVNRQVLKQARQYGIHVHKYPTVQINVEDPYHRADGTFDRSQYWRGQEQWIEYLAVSFEVVQRRAQELGADLSFKRENEEWPESVRAFSQWHRAGIVEAFSKEVYNDDGLGAWYGTESLDEASNDWADHHRAAQDIANVYYGRVKEHLWAALNGFNAP